MTKILCIEDELRIAQSIKKGLEEKNFVVDHAADGERGAYLAKLHKYDLIILDNNLPKKTGYEVCKELRENKNHTPIIMLSVEGTKEQRVKLLNIGADDYIVKPFYFEELHAQINAILRRHPVIIDDVLTADTLELDYARHEVRRSGKVIDLTNKEFMLLRLLMQHKGRVLSRAEIMEKVWDMNANPFSNTIESHILSLRKKIHRAGEKKIIVTVSGRGYKVEE